MCFCSAGIVNVMFGASIFLLFYHAPYTRPPGHHTLTGSAEFLLHCRVFWGQVTPALPTHGTGPKIRGQVPCRHSRSDWSPEVCFRKQRHAAGQFRVSAYGVSSSNLKDLTELPSAPGMPCANAPPLPTADERQEERHVAQHAHAL